MILKQKLMHCLFSIKIEIQVRPHACSLKTSYFTKYKFHVLYENTHGLITLCNLIHAHVTYLHHLISNMYTNTIQFRLVFSS